MSSADCNLKASAIPSLAGAGEFTLTAQDFSKIVGIMHREAGISLPENKTNLVYSRLAKRLRILKLKNFHEYCKLVEDQHSESGRTERDAMIAALTTNVTRFFREPHHFEHLKMAVLPNFIHQAKQGKPVRLWSSACSSGQEPYSMALTILSIFPDAANYDIRILATDIDPNMIALGTAGIYENEALSAVPSNMSQRWFNPAHAGHMQAASELRALVTFRKLNLIGPWPMRGSFQAIFCRNVVIYFDVETQNSIWARMVPLLSPEAALYIGHSERVGGDAEKLLRSDGVTIYRHAKLARAKT